MPQQDIPAEQQVSRFAQRDQVNLKTRVLKAKLFLPRPNSSAGRHELSICWSEGMASRDIWGICAEHFDTAIPDRAVARADGRAGAFYAHELSIEVNGSPYARHADVIDWQEGRFENDDARKAYWLRMGQDMVNRYRMVIRE